MKSIFPDFKINLLSGYYFCLCAVLCDAIENMATAFAFYI